MKPVLAGAAASLLAAAGGACGTPSPALPESGERVYRQCQACHALEPGADTPAGPTLHALVGRPVASRPGFNYSPALRALAEREPRWTPELLDRFLAAPEAVAPGTEMAFPGIADPDSRRAIIAWLDARD